MIQKLLIAYDGSKESECAFDFGLELANRYDSQIEVLSVARPPEPPTMVETTAVLEDATDYYKKLFQQLKSRAAKKGKEIKAEVVVGHPAEQILHRAQQIQADTIVMGHQTRGLLGKWLLGSVADRVIDHAQCNVIIVKEKPE